MLLQLPRYNLNIVYKPGKELFIAHTLSRAFLPNKPSTEELKLEVLSVKQEEYLIQSIKEISMVEFLPITSERLVDLRRKTELDEGLQQLKHIIKIGWPETKEEVPSEIRGYFDLKEELSIQDSILFKGNRVIVPVALRPYMITQVHSSHLGIESCLNEARDVLFWPGMTAEIKDCVSKCETCNTYQTNQQKEALIPHDPPKCPWSRVAPDLFSFDNKEWFIIVDHWPDYFELNQLSSTNSSSLIKSLKNQFARHGIPDTLYSDNGPQSASREFKEFASAWHFDHQCPHHTIHNEMARLKNAVKTAKKLLTKAKASGQDPYLAILDWRNTPSPSIGSLKIVWTMHKDTVTYSRNFVTAKDHGGNCRQAQRKKDETSTVSQQRNKRAS